MTTTTKLPPVHPGEILRHEFLDALDLSEYRVAQAIHVPPRRINEIVHGKRAITADTAVRLARFFGVSAEFWMNLQAKFDLDHAEDALADELKTVATYVPAESGRATAARAGKGTQSTRRATRASRRTAKR